MYMIRVSALILYLKRFPILVATECENYEFTNEFVCGEASNYTNDSCQVGGCPLDGHDLRPAEDRQNGWMIRAEPCGDFWKYNPAWSGLHITMTTIQFYSEPQKKFGFVKNYVQEFGARTWIPEDFVFSNDTCGPSPNETFPTNILYVPSRFLTEVGQLLAGMGFDAVTSGHHISLGYPGGIAIEADDHEENAEFQKITQLLKSVEWRLVLLRMNNVTRTVDKYDAVQLEVWKSTQTILYM